MRRIVIGSGLSLAVLAGYRAVLAEPAHADEAAIEVVESVPVHTSQAISPARPTPVPSSLHLLATGLLLVPAAHKLRLIPR